MSLITSPAGHDGFLIETEQIGAVIRAGLSGDTPQRGVQ